MDVTLEHVSLCRGYKSLPPNQPGTFLSGAVSGHDDVRSAHTLPKTAPRAKALTAYSKIDFKDIVLITDGNDGQLMNIIPLTTRTFMMSYNAYDTVAGHRDHDELRKRQQDMLFKICCRCVWVYMSTTSIKNANFIKFIKTIIENKIMDAGNDTKLKHILSVHLIVENGICLRDIPKDLKPISAVEFRGSSAELTRVVRFLEGTSDTLMRRIETNLNAVNGGAFLHIYVQLKLLGASQENNRVYLERAFKALDEVFTDFNSYCRQHLQQLHHIPNVRILDQLSSSKDYKICLELRPLNLEDIFNFLNNMNSTFSDMLQSHVKVSNQPFSGQIQVSHDVSNVIEVIEHFSDENTNIPVREIGKYIDEGNFHEVERLIGRVTSSTENAQVLHPILKLKVILATCLYEKLLRDPDSSPYRFLRELHRLGCPHMLGIIRNQKGYNALHLSILHERADFMKMLYFSGMWGVLRKDTVQPVGSGSPRSATHEGYTPRRLAEAFSAKGKGYEILCEFQRFDQYWENLPALHKACMAGRLDYASTILESHHALVERKDDTGSNCLLYACISHNQELVAYLLSKKAPRNVLNIFDESALHITAMYGHTAVLKIMSQYKFDIHGIRNKDGYCAIDYCAMHGDIGGLKHYLDNDFPIGHLTVIAAVKAKQTGVVRFLLQHSPNLKDKLSSDEQDKEMRSAVHYAVLHGEMDTLKVLLDHASNISHPDIYGKNIFHLAAEKNNTEVVDLLMQRIPKSSVQTLLEVKDFFTGKNLNVVVRGKDHGRRAWHWMETERLKLALYKKAMSTGHIDVAKYGKIIKSGFGMGPDAQAELEINKRSEENLQKKLPDKTPLHIAVMSKNYDVATKLLECGADPNAKDLFDATPVHYAAINGHVEILKTLESFGGNIKEQIKEDTTVETLAEDHGNMLVLNYIQAKSLIEKAKGFRCSALEGIANNFTEDNLNALRNGGEDIKRHIITQLRDLTININQLLLHLGSGPITEESSSSS